MTERSSPPLALEGFRARALSTGLGTIVLALGLAAPFQLVMYARNGELVRLGIPLVLVLAAYTYLYRGRDLPHVPRTVAVVALASFLGGLSLLSHGLFGTGRLILLASAFFATLLLGGKAGGRVLGSAFVVAVIGVSGVVPYARADLDFSRPSVWIAADAVTLLLPLVVIVPIGILLSDLEGSLVYARRLVDEERAAQERAETLLAEAAENRARMQAILEYSTATIFVKDLEGRFLLVNPELERRVARTDLLGKTDYDLFPAEVADQVRAHDVEVARTGRPRQWREEVPVSGETQTYVSVKFPVRDASGVIYAMGGMSTDVTELTRAEARRREHEAVFAAAFDACPDAIGISGADDGGKFSRLNPGFCALMGRTLEESLGKTSVELGFWAEPAARIPLMQRLMRDGEVRDYEIKLLMKGGQPKTSLFSAKIIEARGGREVLAVVRDVTEQRRAEAELARLHEELEARVLERTQSLEATNRDLEAFSYTVSHDLRAPLRHMAGYIDLVREKLSPISDAETARLVSVVAESAAKMGVLIDDLLRFARLGRVEMAFTDVDLGGLAREVAKELDAQHADRRVRWEIGPLPVAKVDRALMRQVFVNLFDNAVKYTRGRDVATVRVGSRAIPGVGWEISVADDGEGFDMRYADRLFGVFQRLHPDFEGTGVGLAHVKRIVDRHGGSVRAEGKVGAGAVFAFVLPGPAEETAA